MAHRRARSDEQREQQGTAVLDAAAVLDQVPVTDEVLRSGLLAKGS